MTDPDDLLEEITDVLAFLAIHADQIPPHRRAQALIVLERVERFIPTIKENQT